ncbi:hypothetical protein XI02_30315 [Bradyrhizobium sp. CCBAU 21365]|nr:hypothetical protein XI02_30315 [Bradyrhizobium sp. CCBAU 21365]
MQTAYTTVDSAKDCQGIYMADVCRGVEIHDYTQTGSVSGLSVVRFARLRARDMFMSGDFDTVYYPGQFPAKRRPGGSSLSYPAAQTDLISPTTCASTE